MYLDQMSNFCQVINLDLKSFLQIDQRVET